MDLKNLQNLTVKMVQEQVERIGYCSGDDEAAHGMEDELHQTVLAAIAKGAEPADELAAEALKTVDLDFARWCA